MSYVPQLFNESSVAHSPSDSHTSPIPTERQLGRLRSVGQNSLGRTSRQRLSQISSSDNGTVAVVVSNALVVALVLVVVAAVDSSELDPPQLVSVKQTSNPSQSVLCPEGHGLALAQLPFT